MEEVQRSGVGRSLRTTVVLFLVAITVVTGFSRGVNPAQEGVPKIDHVFLIIGENTDYSHVDANNMPYLMTTLRPASAWFTQYYAATHWSQANYVALTTGDFTRCEQQDYGIACHRDVDNLFHQLEVARMTWKVWLEGGAARCDTGMGGTCESTVGCPLTGFYTTGNPPIEFDNIEGPNGVWNATTPSQDCLQNDVPAGLLGMEWFNENLTAGTVANFNFVIPNGCEDGEGNCAPINNRYTQFDAFLAREVPLIQASPAFGKNDVIIVLYDEDMRQGGMTTKDPLGQGGHTVCTIYGPSVVPGEYDALTYSYSVLRTMEDGFGLPYYLGAANQVGTLPNAWT